MVFFQIISTVRPHSAYKANFDFQSSLLTCHSILHILTRKSSSQRKRTLFTCLLARADTTSRAIFTPPVSISAISFAPQFFDLLLRLTLLRRRRRRLL